MDSRQLVKAESRGNFQVGRAEFGRAWVDEEVRGQCNGRNYG